MLSVPAMLKSILSLVILTFSASLAPSSYAPSLKYIEAYNALVKPSETHCLAMALHYEAGNQGYVGQKAVADVVLNRAKAWKKSVCQVVWQPGQFSFLNGKKIAPKFPQKYLALARNLLTEHHNGRRIDSTKGSKWFFTIASENYLTKKLQVVAVIGNHKFMREKT